MSLSVNMVGQNLAMDGRTNTNSDVVKHVTSGYTPPASPPGAWAVRANDHRKWIPPPHSPSPLPFGAHPG